MAHFAAADDAAGHLHDHAPADHPLADDPPHGDLIDPSAFVSAAQSRDQSPAAAEEGAPVAPDASEEPAGTEGAEEQPEGGPQTVNTTGAYRRAALWRVGDPGVAVDAVSDELVLATCWRNPAPEHFAGILVVEQAVRETWEASGNVRFDFEFCDDEDPEKAYAIRIKIRDTQPMSYVGKDGAGLRTTMWLNFTFQRWGTACQPESGAFEWENCVHSIAVHEFGHALGLHHEHDRLFFGEAFHQLAPPLLAQHLDECRAHKVIEASTTADAISEGLVTTEYDPDSVMNYCTNIYERKITLSPFDVVALNDMYGG